jgi:hypothetical protein
MLYEVTGTPVVLTGSGSQRAAIPALGNHGAIRLTLDTPGFFAFGDSMVVADDDAASSAILGPVNAGFIEFIVPTAGATHIAVLGGSGSRATVTPVRVIR